MRERRGAVVGTASVAVVCLCAGAVVAFGGSDGPAGYVAVGAAGGSPGERGPSVAPTGKVRLVPLDPAGPESSSRQPPVGSASPGAKGSASAAGGAPGPGASGGGPSPGDTRTESRTGTKPGTGSDTGSDAGNNSPTTPGSSAPGSSSAPAPAEPAALKVGEPVLKDTDRRWCQDVTLVLRNSGGSAVRSGTVTFGTHIIGALGIDWATVESTEKLPVPLGAGEEKKKTWTVCVESWRVPLGMHVETRDVSVDWT
ncbi:hypothetical protein [Streptomyces sp. NPDC050264]|uniref:hypothetical protein n=1 Tax=Streptomyces sp. NPDC050264 TaxID=3155038 RepID=UPI003416EC17